MKRLALIFSIIVMGFAAQATDITLKSDSSLVGTFLTPKGPAQLVVQFSADGKISIMSYAFNFIVTKADVVSDDRLAGGKLIVRVGKALLIIERRKDATLLNEYTLLIDEQSIKLEPRSEIFLDRQN